MDRTQLLSKEKGRKVKSIRDSFSASVYGVSTRTGLRDRKIMISSVNIRGYRALENFEMAGLGRVNLLVGRNNTGKTSILEGLYILASGNNPSALWNVLARRGEQILPEPAANRGIQAEVDVSHLFHGHEIASGLELSLSTTNDKPGRSVKYRIGEAKPEDHPQLFAHLAEEGFSGPRLALWGTGRPDFSMPPLPLSRAGSLRLDTLQQYANIRAPKAEMGAAQFVTTESFSFSQIYRLWDSIVLTPDEERVMSALQILEPRIERIAQAQVGLIQIPGQSFGMPNRGGFFVRLKGNDKRIPIGSFGDGIWRMLAIAVALVRAKDSLLLIDEIDTGLHYTVMSDMWKLVYDAAKLFNVQVFATTHSYDCVTSLATICDPRENDRREVTIQRLETGRSKAIPFSEAEIAMAADRKIEIR